MQTYLQSDPYFTNQNVPMGFTPYRPDVPVQGAPIWQKYFIAGTDTNAVYIGDPIVLTTGLAPDNYTPIATRATAGSSNPASAIMQALSTESIAVSIPNGRAATLGLIQEQDGVYLLGLPVKEEQFFVMADGIVTAAQIGLNANFTLGSGAGGMSADQSTAVLQTSSIGTGNQLQIMQVVDTGINSNLLDSNGNPLAYARLVVKFLQIK